ncbi:MAG: hypothetical protein ACOC8K_09250 [Gemmatimonadota bacterium]
MGADPAHAQAGGLDLGNLDTRISSGIYLPVGTYGDYYGFGPNVGLDVAYPLADRVQMLLDLDLDLLKNDATYVPDGSAWRYRLGLQGRVVEGDGVLVTGHLGAGATTVRTDDLVFTEDPFRSERIAGTRFTGTGGLRLGFEMDGGLAWWVGADLNWSPAPEEDAQLLREVSPTDLEPLDSETTVGISLGLSLP